MMPAKTSPQFENTSLHLVFDFSFQQRVGELVLDLHFRLRFRFHFGGVHFLQEF